jgi:hypothetical protein
MPESIENDSPEMSFRRGYQHGVIDMFRAIERFLDPATRDVLKDWIEKDIYVWRTKAMLGYPPLWRLQRLIPKLADPDSCCAQPHRDIHCKNLRWSNGI